MSRLMGIIAQELAGVETCDKNDAFGRVFITNVVRDERVESTSERGGESVQRVIVLAEMFLSVNRIVR